MLRSSTRSRRLVTLTVTAAAMLTGPGAAAAAPTCSTTMGVPVHGTHIVGDYVMGTGSMTLDWPPKGGVVGAAVGGSGAALPGGPGPGFHFPNGIAPGASFCLLQSQAPGNHPGP